MCTAHTTYYYSRTHSSFITTTLYGFFWLLESFLSPTVYFQNIHLTKSCLTSLVVRIIRIYLNNLALQTLSLNEALLLPNLNSSCLLGHPYQLWVCFFMRQPADLPIAPTIRRKYLHSHTESEFVSWLYHQNPIAFKHRKHPQNGIPEGALTK